jgi:catechol 2,3-dioxygenase-like lactoylglutathione lyase family enzyme
MTRVLGIGGIFIRAKNPAALADWYRDHLGLPVDPAWNGAVLPLRHEEDREGAYAVWSAFAPDTEYFGRRDNAFMINFRVANLDALLAALRAEGCEVDAKVERTDFGAFGWVTDPEGNRVELWEPPAGS